MRSWRKAELAQHLYQQQRRAMAETEGGGYQQEPAFKIEDFNK